MYLFKKSEGPFRGVAALFVLDPFCVGVNKRANLSTFTQLSVSEGYALPVLYNHTGSSGHSFDVLAIDRFHVIN
jgi:hypothetical protein